MCGSEHPGRTALNAVEYEEYDAGDRGEEIYQDLCSLQRAAHAEVIVYFTLHTD